MVDKTSVADWDTTPIDNDNVDGITLAENGTRPPMVNNAFRAIMSQIADLFGTAVTFSSGQKTQFQQNFDLEPGVDIPGKLDVRRNRIVNHDMRVSQENGTTSGTTNGRYPVDQWAQYFVTSAGTLTVAQVASVTPAGSPNRLRATVTVADASLAAGEYWTISQNLEGSNVADFQFGGASAKNGVLRFGFKGPAGTYAARVGNSAANRSFVALFTITAPQANTDTVQTITITGDTTGTWLTADGVIGMTLDITLACGSTFQGATGWQSGTIFGTSAVSNGMGTVSAVFELFDVGLRMDPDATGVYGIYEIGDESAVWRPYRYWRQLNVDMSYYMNAGGAGTQTISFEEMCKTPTAAILVGGSSSNITSTSSTPKSKTSIEVGGVATATGNTAISGRVLSLNARL